MKVRWGDRPRRADIGFEDAAAPGDDQIRAGSDVLECSAQDRKWLMRENNDYLLADQPWCRLINCCFGIKPA